MRPEVHDYFMEIANVVAKRATCDRKHVGAVIVKNKNILATGYNGSMPGADHCDDCGHMMEDGHCVATVHGEANAIAQAAKNGVSVQGATIYINTFPCWNCFKLIVSSGIYDIVYEGEYRIDEKVVTHANLLRVSLTNIKHLRNIKLP